MTTATVLSIIGLIITIIGSVWKLSTAIAECTAAVKNLTERIDRMDSDNEKDHNAMWDKLEAQEGELADHETRLQLLERK